MKKSFQKLTIGLIACVLLLSFVPLARAQGEAEELSSACVFEPAYIEEDRARLLDSDHTTRFVLGADGTFAVSWDSALVAQFYYELSGLPESGFSIVFFNAEGEQLSSVYHEPDEYTGLLTVPSGAVSLRLEPASTTGISMFRAFSEGELPSELYAIDTRSQHLDFLAVVAHCRDELELGAVFPCLGGLVDAQGGVLYITDAERGEIQSCLAANKALGVSRQPIFLGFAARGGLTSIDQARQYWNEQELLLELVRKLRRLRPYVLIIPSQSDETDAQDAYAAQLAIEAAELAADVSFDNESLDAYGVWSVMKVYEHNAATNTLTLDTQTGIASLDGMTAAQVVNLAAERYGAGVEPNYDALGGFALVYSTVGEDTSGFMLENVASFELISGEEETSYSDDFASPIPVTEPPSTAEGLILSQEEEDEEQDYSVSEVEPVDNSSAIWNMMFLPIAGAGISLLLFIFGFKYMRFSKGTVMAILLCLLPLIFLGCSYLVITRLFV
ncbi:MAG: hypothetical protein Q4C04_07540 [Clostridia bacterium]|nr:hypothetical protein [Clostridia bacterium]